MTKKVFIVVIVLISLVSISLILKINRSNQHINLIYSQSYDLFSGAIARSIDSFNTLLGEESIDKNTYEKIYNQLNENISFLALVQQSYIIEEQYMINLEDHYRLPGRWFSHFEHVSESVSVELTAEDKQFITIFRDILKEYDAILVDKSKDNWWMTYYESVDEAARWEIEKLIK